MAKQKFTHYVPRPKPRKRPGRHTKNLNKSKKRSYKKYNRQGRWQVWYNILDCQHERKKYNYKSKWNDSKTMGYPFVGVKLNEKSMETF